MIAASRSSIHPYGSDPGYGTGREKPAFAGEENAAAHHRQPAARAASACGNGRPGPEVLAARRGNSKGHRAVGGMRASIYNAMPIEGVKRLVERRSLKRAG